MQNIGITQIIRHFSAAILLVTVVSACGNKGPLYVPAKPQPTIEGGLNNEAVSDPVMDKRAS